MKKLFLLCFLFGCSPPNDSPIRDFRTTHNGFYTGYTLYGEDSASAQITVWQSDTTLYMTVSISGELHPFDTWLWLRGSRYIGADSSTAEFTGSSLVWKNSEFEVKVKK